MVAVKAQYLFSSLTMPRVFTPTGGVAPGARSRQVVVALLRIAENKKLPGLDIPRGTITEIVQEIGVIAVSIQNNSEKVRTVLALFPMAAVQGQTPQALAEADAVLDELVEGGEELVQGARVIGGQLDDQIKKAGDINAGMDRAEEGISKARTEVRAVTTNRWVFSVWIVAGVLVALIAFLWFFWHPKKE